MEERYSIIRARVACEIVNNKELIEDLLIKEPLLAKIMFDKFKEYLNDDFFLDIERQTLLMQFLEHYDNLEIIRDILKFTQDCELAEDYTRIIFEWNYRASDFIRKSNLRKYDGFKLSQTKKEVQSNIKQKDKEKSTYVDYLENLVLNAINSVNSVDEE